MISIIQNNHFVIKMDQLWASRNRSSIISLCSVCQCIILCHIFCRWMSRHCLGTAD